MAGSASAAVIDFENFDPGRIIDDEYAPDVFISAINLSSGPDVALIFDTTDLNPASEDFDLVGPFDSDNASLSDNFSPGNVLIIQERNDCNFDSGFCATPDDEGSRPAGEFTFLFSSDIILETIDFFDIELIEDNGNPDSEIHLFDSNGDELLAGMFFVPSTGGNNKWNQLDFDSVRGVRKIVIELGGSGAIDNLHYQVVPVPAAAWLFGSAIGLLGWMRNRRRGAPAAST
ncbi:MAG: thrombospondin type 3 repeat:Cna B-type [Gammaproteobacteria bacterium]|nr:MAG: thrombospondin type 3 repeat:Cna B-type [Gammaproteobacteria bacterium]